MTPVAAIAADSPRSSSMGPRLPLIVSKAAVEFDRAIQGNPIGFESAKLLSDHLKIALRQRPGQGLAPTYFDSATIGIVGRAISPDPTAGTTIADIVNSAWDLAEMMSESTPESDSASLEKCRLFCIEFGNSMIRFSESLAQFKPANPHKR